MTIKIGSTPYCQWQVLSPLFECFNWNESQASDAETWYQSGLVASRQEKYILLVSRPEIAIARAMIQGEEPQGALRKWHVAQSQLLSFYKANRRDTVLLEVRNAANNTQACIGVIKSHLGLKFEGVAPRVDIALQEPDINQLLAHQLVAQAGELVAPLAELEACITPLGEEVFTVPILDVLALHKQQNSHSVQELTDVKEENELLLLQLCQVQEELEKYYSENKALKQRGYNERAQNNNTNELKSELEALKVRVDISGQKVALLSFAKTTLMEAKSLFSIALQHLEFEKKSDTESTRLKAQIAEKSEAIARISSTTEFYFYENDARCFLSPLDVDVVINKGMPPEAIAGEYLKGRDNATTENFVINTAFVKFLHWVITKHIAQYPVLQVVATQKLSGESQVADLRGLGENGELADSDCIGVVEFVDGKIVSYDHNDTYNPFSERGYMQLDPWFQGKYIEELTKLAETNPQNV